MRLFLTLLALVILLGAVARFKLGVSWSDLRLPHNLRSLAILIAGGMLAGASGYRIDQLRELSHTPQQLTLARIGLVIGIGLFLWGAKRLPAPRYSGSLARGQTFHRALSVRLRRKLEDPRPDASRGAAVLKAEVSDLEVLRPLAVQMVDLLPETHDLLARLDERIAEMRAALRDGESRPTRL